MKLSFMTFACPDWPLTEVVQAARRHGYHGVELRVGAHHHHGVEVDIDRDRRREFARVFEGEGVEPCCLATSLQFIHAAAAQDAPALIDLASEIGCPALRVFCGPLPESVALADAAGRVAENLRHAAHAAVQSGVQLWLETHDTYCKAADAAAAVRHADHPALGINYDNMHPYRKGESVEETFAALGDLIRHTHFHDALNHPDQVVIKPVGEGELPIDDMFAALAKTGYAGYLSGEWFGPMYGADPDTALARYRDDMTRLADKHGVQIG
jgi:sugar phosphate isomerase/epimerase